MLAEPSKLLGSAQLSVARPFNSVSRPRDEDSRCAIAWTASPGVFDIVINGLTWVNSPSTAIDTIATNLDTLGLGIFAGAEPAAALTGANQIPYSHNNIDVACSNQICRRLTVDITAQHDVPEPAALALLSLGLIGVGFSARSKC